MPRYLLEFEPCPFTQSRMLEDPDRIALEVGSAIEAIGGELEEYRVDDDRARACLEVTMSDWHTLECMLMGMCTGGNFRSYSVKPLESKTVATQATRDFAYADQEERSIEHSVTA